ncbi:hypothetical protein EV363DRAFT_1427310 [Boletus edulis]|nr:hypothetical protein EV363DRAFT_1427310 [Boletus edulis]
MFGLRRSFTLLKELPVRSLPRKRLHSTLAEDVRSHSTFHIPIIDFSAFRANTALSEKRRVADDIVNGFKEAGFVYLSGHGIPGDVIDNVHKKSAAFFCLPHEVKDQVAWDDPRANRGYVKVGRERVTQSSDATEIAALRTNAPDMKETMEIGRDWDPVWRNKWPKEADSPGYKQTMLQFFQTCHELHVTVMRSVALGLDLPECFFDQKIDQQHHNLRLLSYPSIRTKLLSQEGQARAGAHSDYGTITLLFQDSVRRCGIASCLILTCFCFQVGGLEVQNPHTQQFQPAAPIPGTIVVNAGDLLARWSNDVLRSTLHRVVAPPVTEDQSLPTCVNETNPSKYGSVTTEEYIVGRLAATYD